MSLSLIYDPATVTNADAQARASALGIPTVIRGAPARLLPLPVFDGYCVVRERWDGTDVLVAPVTLGAIQALPALTPDPRVTAQQTVASAGAVLAFLQSTPIDPVKLNTNLNAVAAYRNLSNPTATQAIAVIDPLIDVVADLIRYVLSKS